MNVVLVPTRNSSALLPPFLSRLSKLEDVDRVVFFVNNLDDDTADILRKWDGEVIERMWPTDYVRRLDSVYGPIAVARQILLNRARALKADFALFLDDDIWVDTADAIDILRTWGYDIIGGTYARVFPDGICIAAKWMDPITRKVSIISDPYDILMHPFVVGGGCMGLSRGAIEDRHLNFFPLAGPQWAEDFGYCVKARARGYTIALDNLVHLTHNLRPSSRELKPWSAGATLDWKYISDRRKD
jgi:glycosyltransferase involved in cell wall biosynthesis